MGLIGSRKPEGSKERGNEGRKGRGKEEGTEGWREKFFLKFCLRWAHL
jgi:hypothetical protein